MNTNIYNSNKFVYLYMYKYKIKKTHKLFLYRPLTEVEVARGQELVLHTPVFPAASAALGM